MKVSDHDETGHDWTCVRVDQLEETAKAVYYAVRVWRLVLDF